jgi:hypothetical protein
LACLTMGTWISLCGKTRMTIYIRRTNQPKAQ